MNGESYYTTVGGQRSDRSFYAMDGSSNDAPMGAAHIDHERCGELPSYYSEPGRLFTFEDLKKLLSESH